MPIIGRRAQRPSASRAQRTPEPAGQAAPRGGRARTRRIGSSAKRVSLARKLDEKQSFTAKDRRVAGDLVGLYLPVADVDVIIDARHKADFPGRRRTEHEVLGGGVPFVTQERPIVAGGIIGPEVAGNP